MAKMIFLAFACVLVCSVSACSSTWFTKVTMPGGATVTHGNIDKGTMVTRDEKGGFTIDTRSESVKQTSKASAQ